MITERILDSTVQYLLCPILERRKQSLHLKKDSFVLEKVSHRTIKMTSRLSCCIRRKKMYHILTLLEKDCIDKKNIYKRWGKRRERSFLSPSYCCNLVCSSSGRSGQTNGRNVFLFTLEMRLLSREPSCHTSSLVMCLFLRIRFQLH